MRSPLLQSFGSTFRKLPIFTQSLFANTLISRIAILGSGTALAQLANIVATPLLAYLYSPSQFGAMAIFMGLVVIIGSLASLGYEAAIVLPEDNSEARSIGLLAIFIALVVAVLSGVVLWALQSIGYIDILSAWSLLVLAPMGAFSLSAFNVACQWRLRGDDVKTLSIANVIRTIGALLAQILAAAFGLHHMGLILGRLIGQISATFYIFRSIGLLSGGHACLSLQSLGKVARKHVYFPMYRTPQSLLAHVTEQIPAFALGFLFGASSAGLYWLAHRVLKLPCTVLSEATARVYHAECARRYRRDQRISRLTHRTIAGLAALAIVPSAMLFLFTPEIFSILGEEWRQAGEYGRWLSIWMLFTFSCSPIMCLFSILNCQALLLKIDALSMIGRVLLITYMSFFHDPVLLVAALSIFESLKIVATTLIASLLCHVADKRLVKKGARPLEAS